MRRTTGFAFLLTLALFSFSLHAATAPAPPPKEPSPKPTGGGGSPPKYVPPENPFPPRPLEQRRTVSPDPVVVQAPYTPPPPPEVPKFKPFIPKPVVAESPRPRPSLFFTKRERRFRSPVFPKALEIKVGGLNDSTLALKTVARETEIDATAVASEHENDVQLAETNRKLHDQMKTLYAKNVVAKAEYEESRTRFVRSQSKADESKAKLIEYQCELAVIGLKIAQTKGQAVSLVQLAQGYFLLWQARVDKVKATREQARASEAYYALILDMHRKLTLKGGSTKEDVIKAERDAEEAAILFRLSDSLVQKMEKFRDDAEQDLNAVRKAVGPEQGGIQS